MQKINVAKLQPLAGYVLVEPAEKDIQTSSGILLPTDKIEKPQYGKILALGKTKSACTCSDDCECAGSCKCDHQDKNCDCDECSCEDCDCKDELKVGDVVIYKKWGGNDVKIDDIEYQLLKYEDILAKVN